jgi:hypothetical protein
MKENRRFETPGRVLIAEEFSIIFGISCRQMGLSQARDAFCVYIKE